MVINGNGSDRHIRNALEELKLKETMGKTHVSNIRESNTYIGETPIRKDSEGGSLRT